MTSIAVTLGVALPLLAFFYGYYLTAGATRRRLSRATPRGEITDGRSLTLPERLYRQEEANVGRAKDAYVDGTLSFKEFCSSLDVALAGGGLTQDGRPFDWGVDNEIRKNIADGRKTVLVGGCGTIIAEYPPNYSTGVVYGQSKPRRCRRGGVPR